VNDHGGVNPTADRPVAFVTGASRGIGKQAALALARRGFDVVIAARTVTEGTAAVLPSSSRDAAAMGTFNLPGSLQTTAEAIAELGTTAYPVAMDLLQRDSVEAAAAAAVGWRGHLDAMVLAAIYQGPGNMDRVADLSIEDAETIVRGNYLHQLALIKAVLPAILERGGGAIVNITSFTARHDPPGAVGEGGWGMGYAAGKAAMHRVAGHLHAEFATCGIRAYNVDPGNVVTEMAQARGGALNAHGDEPDLPGAVAAWLCTLDDETLALAGQTVIAPKLRHRFA
jgi:NAD(P)-dependent dehydrogenase (short-subunit alcohol dehydrogenase family)